MGSSLFWEVLSAHDNSMGEFWGWSARLPGLWPGTVLSQAHSRFHCVGIHWFSDSSSSHSGRLVIRPCLFSIWGCVMVSNTVVTVP